MERLNLTELAERIRQRRAGKGIREAAKEVGVSPATLSRVENEKIPDLETFGRICEWLGDDPSKYLGIRSHASETGRAQVHFKKNSTIDPETAKALGELIMLAQEKLLKEQELLG